MLKSRILFAVSVLCAAVLSIGYRDAQAGFTVLYALLLLGAFCALSVLLAPKCLTFHENAATGVVFKDEQLGYTLTLRNRGPFIYPSAVYRFYNSELITLEGDSSLGVCEPLCGQRREYKVRFPYRGVYKLGLESVTVTDMFGLFRRTIRNKNPLQLTVFPERDDDFAATMSSEAVDAILQKDVFSEDYSALVDLRKADSSDSLRKIHWKLSAKRGELIAKNFQNFEPEQTILLLDTADIGLPPRQRAAFEDKIVSYMAAAADFYARENLPARLIYGQPGIDELQIDTAGDIDAVFALLAGVAFERKTSPLCELGPAPDMCGMIAFLSDIDQQRCSVIKNLCSLERGIAVYLFESEHAPLCERKKKMLEELHGLGVFAFVVKVSEENAPEAQEGGAA